MREKNGRGVQVVNLSKSGATIRDVLDTQLPRLPRLQPDVVTVAIGATTSVPMTQPASPRMSKMLTAALPAGTLIADVPDFMAGRWADHAIEAGMITTGAGAHQLRVIPLHATQRSRGARAMLTDFAADWFHPNDRGHGVWADAFWNEL